MNQAILSEAIQLWKKSANDRIRFFDKQKNSIRREQQVSSQPTLALILLLRVRFCTFFSHCAKTSDIVQRCDASMLLNSVRRSRLGRFGSGSCVDLTRFSLNKGQSKLSSSFRLRHTSCWLTFLAASVTGPARISPTHRFLERKIAFPT